MIEVLGGCHIKDKWYTTPRQYCCIVYTDEAGKPQGVQTAITAALTKATEPIRSDTQEKKPLWFEELASAVAKHLSENAHGIVNMLQFYIGTNNTTSVAVNCCVSPCGKALFNVIVEPHVSKRLPKGKVKITLAETREAIATTDGNAPYALTSVRYIFPDRLPATSRHRVSLSTLPYPILMASSFELEVKRHGVRVQEVCNEIEANCLSESKAILADVLSSIGIPDEVLEDLYSNRKNKTVLIAANHVMPLSGEPPHIFGEITGPAIGDLIALSRKMKTALIVSNKWERNAMGSSTGIRTAIEYLLVTPIGIYEVEEAFRNFTKHDKEIIRPYSSRHALMLYGLLTDYEMEINRKLIIDEGLLVVSSPDQLAHATKRIVKQAEANAFLVDMIYRAMGYEHPEWSKELADELKKQETATMLSKLAPRTMSRTVSAHTS